MRLTGRFVTNASAESTILTDTPVVPPAEIEGTPMVNALAVKLGLTPEPNCRGVMLKVPTAVGLLALVPLSKVTVIKSAPGQPLSVYVVVAVPLLVNTVGLAKLAVLRVAQFEAKVMVTGEAYNVLLTSTIETETVVLPPAEIVVAPKVMAPSPVVPVPNKSGVTVNVPDAAGLLPAFNVAVIKSPPTQP